MSFQVPVNVYTSAIPDDMCMRYGRMINLLQTIHKRANFLDDARFIANIRSGMPRVHAHNPHPNHQNTLKEPLLLQAILLQL